MSFLSAPLRRRLASLAALALVLAVLGLSPEPAGAQTSTQVVFIHAYGNGPGENTYSVCFVGPEVLLMADVVSGDVVEGNLESGDYVVSVYDTFDGDCESLANIPLLTRNITLVDGNSTAVAVWPAFGTSELSIGSTDHDLACVDPGDTRLMASNLADIDPVDLEYDGAALPDMANGELRDIDLLAGTYDLEWVLTGSGANFGVPPFSLALPEATLTHVILAGGLPSAVPVYWTIDYDLPLEVCEQPTTTVAPATVPPPTTAAVVTAATPAFTG